MCLNLCIFFFTTEIIARKGRPEAVGKKEAIKPVCLGVQAAGKTLGSLCLHFWMCMMRSVHIARLAG